MRLQVEKGMLWAENHLAPSSVRKSLFIAICPDFIASVIDQQSQLRGDFLSSIYRVYLRY
jgi:hypothetical protein